MRNSQDSKDQFAEDLYDQPLDLENPKRNAILMAAAKLFLECGYEPVSMDAIATKADVSKRTVYSYFESKAELFSSILVAHCSSMGGIALPQQLAGLEPREILTQFGEVFARMITSPRAIAMQRVIFTEVPRLPEIGEIFFRSGPDRQVKSLAAYLTQAQSEGKLSVPDATYAALLFMSVVKAPFHLHQLCGLTRKVEPEAITKAVKLAVDNFLAAYAAK